MKHAVIGLAVVMLCLHQDIWLWDNTNMVFGFIPVGLAYHACFSIAVALLGWLAIKHLWPHDLERWASGQEDVKKKIEANQYKVQ